ncbi:hypothetical protein SNEBB_003671 [Seison nebaliae]|nr:hypothetical protein SNEBB_003671 [Seison nebaliae]
MSTKEKEDEEVPLKIGLNERACDHPKSSRLKSDDKRKYLLEMEKICFASSTSMDDIEKLKKMLPENDEFFKIIFSINRYMYDMSEYEMSLHTELSCTRTLFKSDGEMEDDHCSGEHCGVDNYYLIKERDLNHIVKRYRQSSSEIECLMDLRNIRHMSNVLLDVDLIPKELFVEFLKYNNDMLNSLNDLFIDVFLKKQHLKNCQNTLQEYIESITIISKNNKKLSKFFLSIFLINRRKYFINYFTPVFEELSKVYEITPNPVHITCIERKCPLLPSNDRKMETEEIKLKKLSVEQTKKFIEESLCRMKKMLRETDESKLIDAFQKLSKDDDSSKYFQYVLQRLQTFQFMSNRFNFSQKSSNNNLYNNFSSSLLINLHNLLFLINLFFFYRYCCNNERLLSPIISLYRQFSTNGEVMRKLLFYNLIQFKIGDGNTTYTYGELMNQLWNDIPLQLNSSLNRIHCLDFVSLNEENVQNEKPQLFATFLNKQSTLDEFDILPHNGENSDWIIDRSIIRSFFSNYSTTSKSLRIKSLKFFKLLLIYSMIERKKWKESYSIDIVQIFQYLFDDGTVHGREIFIKEQNFLEFSSYVQIQIKDCKNGVRKLFIIISKLLVTDYWKHFLFESLLQKEHDKLNRLYQSSSIISIVLLTKKYQLSKYRRRCHSDVSVNYSGEYEKDVNQMKRVIFNEVLEAKSIPTLYVLVRKMFENLYGFNGDSHPFYNSNQRLINNCFFFFHLNNFFQWWNSCNFNENKIHEPIPSHGQIDHILNFLFFLDIFCVEETSEKNRRNFRKYTSCFRYFHMKNKVQLIEGWLYIIQFLFRWWGIDTSIIENGLDMNQSNNLLIKFIEKLRNHCFRYLSEYGNQWYLVKCLTDKNLQTQMFLSDALHNIPSASRIQIINDCVQEDREKVARRLDWYKRNENYIHVLQQRIIEIHLMDEAIAFLTRSGISIDRLDNKGRFTNNNIVWILSRLVKEHEYNLSNEIIMFFFFKNYSSTNLLHIGEISFGNINFINRSSLLNFIECERIFLLSIFTYVIEQNGFSVTLKNEKSIDNDSKESKSRNESDRYKKPLKNHLIDPEVLMIFRGHLNDLCSSIFSFKSTENMINDWKFNEFDVRLQFVAISTILDTLINYIDQYPLQVWLSNKCFILSIKFLNEMMLPNFIQKYMIYLRLKESTQRNLNDNKVHIMNEDDEGIIPETIKNIFSTNLNKFKLTSQSNELDLDKMLLYLVIRLIQSPNNHLLTPLRIKNMEICESEESSSILTQLFSSYELISTFYLSIKIFIHIGHVRQGYENLLIFPLKIFEQLLIDGDFEIFPTILENYRQFLKNRLTSILNLLDWFHENEFFGEKKFDDLRNFYKTSNDELLRALDDLCLLYAQTGIIVAFPADRANEIIQHLSQLQNKVNDRYMKTLYEIEEIKENGLSSILSGDYSEPKFEVIEESLLDSMSIIDIPENEINDYHHNGQKNIFKKIFHAKNSMEITSIETNTTDSEGYSIPEKAPTPDSWTKDDDVKICQCCEQETFSLFVRKHHCRRCGRVICRKCSKYTLPLEFGGTIKTCRVCQTCYEYERTRNIGNEKEGNLGNINKTDSLNNSCRSDDPNVSISRKMNDCLIIFEHNHQNGTRVEYQDHDKNYRLNEKIRERYMKDQMLNVPSCFTLINGTRQKSSILSEIIRWCEKITCQLSSINQLSPYEQTVFATTNGIFNYATNIKLIIEAVCQLLLKVVEKCQMNKSENVNEYRLKCEYYLKWIQFYRSLYLFTNIRYPCFHELENGEKIEKYINELIIDQHYDAIDQLQKYCDTPLNNICLKKIRSLIANDRYEEAKETAEFLYQLPPNQRDVEITQIIQVLMNSSSNAQVNKLMEADKLNDLEKDLSIYSTNRPLSMNIEFESINYEKRQKKIPQKIYKECVRYLQYSSSSHLLYEFYANHQYSSELVEHLLNNFNEENVSLIPRVVTWCHTNNCLKEFIERLFIPIHSDKKNQYVIQLFPIIMEELWKLKEYLMLLLLHEIIDDLAGIGFIHMLLYVNSTLNDIGNTLVKTEHRKYLVAAFIHFYWYVAETYWEKHEKLLQNINRVLPSSRQLITDRPTMRNRTKNEHLLIHRKCFSLENILQYIKISGLQIQIIDFVSKHTTNIEMIFSLNVKYASNESTIYHNKNITSLKGNNISMITIPNIQEYRSLHDFIQLIQLYIGDIKNEIPLFSSIKHIITLCCALMAVDTTVTIGFDLSCKIATAFRISIKTLLESTIQLLYRHLKFINNDNKCHIFFRMISQTKINKLLKSKDIDPIVVRFFEEFPNHLKQNQIYMLDNLINLIENYQQQIQCYLQIGLWEKAFEIASLHNDTHSLKMIRSMATSQKEK